MEFYSEINVVVNAGDTGEGKLLRIITANETFNSECSALTRVVAAGS